MRIHIRVGPLWWILFQNAHSSAVATDVESQIPPNQTDIGSHKRCYKADKVLDLIKKYAKVKFLKKIAFVLFGPEESHLVFKVLTHFLSLDVEPSGPIPHELVV